jgi:tetratricopeptide (TPR) repeat protein
MSLNQNSSSTQLIFDDESNESILHDNPVDSATGADAFDASEQVLEEINQCACSGNQIRSFALMAWLLRSDLPVPVNTCRIIIQAFQQVISSKPKPVVSNVVIEYGFILDKIINLAKQYEADDILSAAETFSYRLCEARGEYEKARTLIDNMREQANKSGDRFLFAELTNNYGYEFLLEGNYLEPQTYFIESLSLFENLNSKINIANGQANLLTCQFALSLSRNWEALLPALSEAQRVLHEYGDWRIRKTMRLFAERAQAQGRNSVAIAWARRAANASRNLATQLHRDDENYLDSLRGWMLQGSLFDHPVNTRQTDCSPEGKT